MLPILIIVTSHQKPRYVITPDDFIESPPAEYFCPITFELLLNPYLSSCCGNHFSKQAVDKFDESCHMCRQNTPNIMLDKAYQRRLLSLKVKCRFRNKGCTWTGEGYDFINHLQEKCLYIDTIPNSENFGE